VQAAVDAAPAGTPVTILIEPGTYWGQVYVPASKPGITLAGATGRARAQARHTVHRLTGTVTGNEPGTVLVRITSVDRGVSSAVIGSTMAVPSIRRFPVGSAVQVRQRAADQAVLSVDPLS
jgi:pectin methylesterase-like acyl-CoA thioesterase